MFLAILKNTRVNQPSNTKRYEVNKWSCRISRLLIYCLLTLPLAVLASIQASEEFQLDATGEAELSGVQVAALQDNGFAAVWESGRYPNEKVYRRLFQNDGTASSDAFVIDTIPGETQFSPRIAKLTDGGYVICMTTRVAEGDSVYCQRFYSLGAALGNPVQVFQPTSFQYVVDVKPFQDGSFVVLLALPKATSAEDEFFARQFNPDSSPKGEGVIVPTDSERGGIGAKTSVLPNGDFVITWSVMHVDTGERIIQAQRYSADGSPIDNKFDVASKAFGDGHPAIVTLPSGGFAITWAQTQGIYAQRFSSDGQPVGNQITVDSGNDITRADLVITALPNNDIIVGWNNGEVLARGFTGSNSPHGPAYQVNTHTDGAQENPAIANLSNGDHIISWTSQASVDDNKNGLFAKLYGPENDLTLTYHNPQPDIFVGDSITLQINAAGRAIYGIDGELTVDNPNIAQLDGAVYGNFFAENERIGMDNSVSESRWLGALTLKEPALPKSGRDTFAELTLYANEAGTTNLVLTAKFADREGNLVLNKTTNYSFNINPSIIVSGNINDWGTNTDDDDFVIFIGLEEVPINPDGSFSIRISPGTHSVQISAGGFLDARNDVEFNVDDAINGVIPMSNITLVAGDCNNDNAVNIADLTLLLGAYRTQRSDGDAFWPQADFNADDVINIQDLSMLGSNFGRFGVQDW